MSTASHTESHTSQMPQAGKPRLIFWEVTKGCNLHCIHCRATATELMSPMDLPTSKARDIIEQIAAYANPILVLSGGEPLYRRDIFELAKLATDRGVRVALATNGTLVTRDVAQKIVDAGVKRVSISLDGADAQTHDSFRGIPGSFEAAVYGFQNLKKLGMPVQINMTIAKHNGAQLPAVLELAKTLGADALHTFLLVPVGCGVDIAAEQMISPIEYERMLNWFYDQSLKGGIELKATCAPHYFRVARQRRAAERKAQGYGATAAPAEHSHGGNGHGISANEVLMPGGTGISFSKNQELAGVVSHGHGNGHGNGHGHPGGDPNAMNAMTKGCLAGSGVCFISHEGEVFPCGYLPVKAGDLRQQSFKDIWQNSIVFEQLRDTNNLEGKCGCCEFRNICMGCRARAFAATGNMMSEEPFCVYQPKQQPQPAH
jgi:AdoMet-dependent heme synthase